MCMRMRMRFTCFQVPVPVPRIEYRVPVHQEVPHALLRIETAENFSVTSSTSTYTAEEQPRVDASRSSNPRYRNPSECTLIPFDELIGGKQTFFVASHLILKARLAEALVYIPRPSVLYQTVTTRALGAALEGTWCRCSQNRLLKSKFFVKLFEAVPNSAGALSILRRTFVLVKLPRALERCC